MLYNVTFGNNKMLPDAWELVKISNRWYYEKKDISQRIRINPPKPPKGIELVNYDMSADTLDLDQGFSIPQIQRYNFRLPMEFINNTVNMNSMLRILDTRDENTIREKNSIVIFVTVLNNYQIINFDTPYQILNTYHKFGMYQGCAVVLTRKELEEINDGTVLTIHAFNRKKEIPQVLTVKFKTDVNPKTKERKINPNVLGTHVTPIKDAAERSRVEQRAKENKNSFLGFKCIVNSKKMMTSTYFVTPELKETIDGLVRFGNKEIVVVDPEIIGSYPDKVKALLKKHCLHKKVRAITTVGVRFPVNELRSARVLFVFDMNPKTKRLTCIKSN